MDPHPERLPLAVLIVEDSPDDAEILLWEIRKGGFDPHFRIVSDEASLRDALDAEEWEIILSDYVMPTFSGLDALALVRSRSLDIPFVIISGRVGEEVAVDAMRRGASDYLLKGHLSRLVEVIRREITESRIRREKQKAEEELWLLKKTVDSLPLGITIAGVDRTIIYANQAEAEMHGYTVSELIGQPVRVLAPPETWVDLSFDLIPTDSTRRRETVNLRKDGSRFPVYAVSTLISDSDGTTPLAMVTCSEDITERKILEMTLRRQMAAIESALDGILIIDLDGTIDYVNQACATMCGWNLTRDLMGQNWRVLYDADGVERVLSEIFPTLEREGKWHGELRARRRRGEPFPIEMSVTKVEGNGYVGVFRDITERKEIEERLAFLSTHDPLTGFFNRNHFEGEIARLEKSRLHPISVIMIDVDGLKQVNDSLGHHAGDELLLSAARAISSAFRTEDVVARIGGDEFVVLLPETDAQAVERAVERIRAKIVEINRENHHFVLSLSIGHATAWKGESFREAVKKADLLMYQDKHARRAGRGGLFSAPLETPL
ncbi:MAG: hypothetical protein Fur0034_16850 [Desulfuromonadia bacterium]